MANMTVTFFVYKKPCSYLRLKYSILLMDGFPKSLRYSKLSHRESRVGKHSTQEQQDLKSQGKFFCIKACDTLTLKPYDNGVTLTAGLCPTVGGSYSNPVFHS